MPTGGGFKVACFSSGIESACCTSDQYLAQCFDPYCEECIVDTNSSTGYGGVFPRSCTSGSNCLGCQSGGYTCPGECKCNPGAGCGCFVPGTYTPMACTGGGCVTTNCYCCLSGSPVERVTNYTITNVGFTQAGNDLYLTQFTYAYTYASCNSDVASVDILFVRKDNSNGSEVSMGGIYGLPLANTSAVWNGSIFISDGHTLYADITISTTSAICTIRREVISI